MTPLVEEFVYTGLGESSLKKTTLRGAEKEKGGSSGKQGLCSLSPRAANSGKERDIPGKRL